MTDPVIVSDVLDGSLVTTVFQHLAGRFAARGDHLHHEFLTLLLLRRYQRLRQFADRVGNHLGRSRIVIDIDLDVLQPVMRNHPLKDSIVHLLAGIPVTQEVYTDQHSEYQDKQPVEVRLEETSALLVLRLLEVVSIQSIIVLVCHVVCLYQRSSTSLISRISASAHRCSRS